MAPGRPREMREVFATTAPSRRPAPVARPGMQRHASSRAVCPKGPRKTSGETASPEFGKSAAPNPIPTQQSPARKETLLRSETVEFRSGSECRTLLAAPSAKAHLQGQGLSLLCFVAGCGRRGAELRRSDLAMPE